MTRESPFHRPPKRAVLFSEHIFGHLGLEGNHHKNEKVKCWVSCVANTDRILGNCKLRAWFMLKKTFICVCCCCWWMIQRFPLNSILHCPGDSFQSCSFSNRTCKSFCIVEKKVVEFYFEVRGFKNADWKCTGMTVSIKRFWWQSARNGHRSHHCFSVENCLQLELLTSSSRVARRWSLDTNPQTHRQQRFIFVDQETD